MVFCNNAAVVDDGTIWFSDSSTVHVLDGLRFANGVGLSASGDYVCVAGTTGRTVVRHWLSGARAGAAWSAVMSPGSTS